MRWKVFSTQDGAAPERGWPEKTNRRMVALTIAILLVGTPLVSVMVFSKHIERGTIEIDPNSHHTVYFGIYGFGRLQYSCSALVWSEVYLLEMDRINFERFEADEDYDYSGYTSIGYGGHGYASMMGMLWEVFFVFVNDSPFPATVEFEADSTTFLSLPASMMLLGAVAATAYVAGRRSGHGTSDSVTPSRAQGGLSERRKSVAAIVGIIALVIAVTIGLGHLLPADVAFVLNSPYQRLWLGIVTGAAVVFGLRFKLHVASGTPEVVLSQLARRLRISGYRVSENVGQLTVQISSTSAIKVIAKRSPGGTVISYRADATPSGWTIVIVPLLIALAAPVGMAFIFFLLYRSAVFASDRILPRLSMLPAPEPTSKREDTHAMLVEGLSEGRRLSAEAYESARSNYEDAVILLVLASLSLSALLAAYAGVFLLKDFEAGTRLTVSLLAGVLAGTISSIVSLRLLGRQSKARIEELRSWTVKLEAALSREAASRPPMDGEPSSFELIAESYKETPKWLKARRKAGMYREPGDWLLIIFFSIMALQLAMAGLMDLLQGNLRNAGLFIASSVLTGAVATHIYLRWRRQRCEEDKGTSESLAKRFQALKSEMEAYIRSV